MDNLDITAAVTLEAKLEVSEKLCRHLQRRVGDLEGTVATLTKLYREQGIELHLVNENLTGVQARGTELLLERRAADARCEAMAAEMAELRKGVGL